MAEDKQLFQIGFEFEGSKSEQVEVTDREEALKMLERLSVKEYLDLDGVQIIGKPKPFVNILRR